MFPTTPGVEGIADEYGADMRSYDINARNRNDAIAACLRIKGWQLVPQGAARQVAAVDQQRPAITEANTVLTCKANAFKASPQAAPRAIDGGVLRFQIGQKAIAVTTAEGGVTTYGIEGTHEGYIVGRARDPNGSQYVVHISATERMFAMLHIVGGQPMEGLSGTCR